jgi:hypothetical protein
VRRLRRLLERRLQGKYAATALLESLRKAEYSHIQENYYLFDFFDVALCESKVILILK